MLQNRTISSSISSTVPTEWGMSARCAREQWQVLAQTLRLPDTWQSFLLFTLGIALACGGASLHLQLSTQILQDKLQLATLQAEERVLEEQNANLVWMVVQETELNKVKVRATALGYQPALKRNYIVIPGDTLTADRQPNIAQADE
jgi:hypothetical protein